MPGFGISREAVGLETSTFHYRGRNIATSRTGFIGVNWSRSVYREHEGYSYKQIRPETSVLAKAPRTSLLGEGTVGLWCSQAFGLRGLRV